MAIVQFPPVEEADEYGLLAVGGDLEVESLELAYRSGIFPWPLFPGGELAWFAPPLRAILRLDDFHLSKTLAKTIRQGKYVCTVDADFSSVIRNCATVRNRPGQKGTWISPLVAASYEAFHDAGFAHSVEVYRGEELVGGLYGVSIGEYFVGESMFHLEPNTSKIALAYLVDELRKTPIDWIDCQIMNPHLKSLGATEITRAEFTKRLETAVNAKKVWPD